MLDDIKFNFVPPRYYDFKRRRSQLSLDYETACDLDLRVVGLDRYTAHPSFRVLMAAYRIDDEPLRQWQPQEGPLPRDLREALIDPSVERWAFNSQFERVVTRRGLKIATPRKGWRCTMVLAYMQSFTGTLSDVGEQVGLPLNKQKLKSGKRLISMFCMPQKVSRVQPNGWRNWITDPVEWQEFLDYNLQDVLAEEAIKNRLIKFPVPDDEWDFYCLDQLINDRGMPVDWDFITNVIQMSDRRKAQLSGEIVELTGIANPNSSAQLLPWLQAHGYPFSDLRKETVEKALGLIGELWNGDGDHPAVKVLRKRQWLSVRSIDKAVAARRTAGAGGRVRFMYQFAGASRTNRFSGRGVQPQNMKRTPKVLDPEDDDTKLTYATDLIRDGNYDGFDLFLNEPMEAFTGCMRSMFRAPVGYEFKVCDYKSVESAGLGWLSDCPRLLNVFRNGLDPYYDFGTLFYNKPYDAITRAERQICKPPTLGCGYGMGAGEIRDGIKTGLLKYAEDMGVQMSPDQAKHAVSVFREGYPEVPQFWYACDRAIRHVLTTHTPYNLGYVRFEWMKPYLMIRLPSGRYIFYYKPRLEQRVINTGRTKWIRSRGVAEHGAPPGVLVEIADTYVKTEFTYMGRNQKTTKWERVSGRGALVVENIDQAFTRDILKVGLTRLHKKGFYLIGHSHDEGIDMGKIGDNRLTFELMREVYSEPISWAPGFPLAAAGWQGNYYRKA